MDAAQYLKSQGWRGEGHALSHTGNGIKKPLLVSKKVDVLGVGLNKHAAVSDQWWMRAYDSGLKDLGTGKQSALSTVREHGVHLGGLYGRFVRGECIAGTFGSEDGSTTEASSVTKGGQDGVGASLVGAGNKRKRMDDVQEVKKQRKLDKAHKSKVDGAAHPALKLKKRVDKQVKAYTQEAVKRGILNPSKKLSKPESTKSVDELAFQQVLTLAGLGNNAASVATDKQAKYEQGKLRRTLERCARKHILAQLSEDERIQIEQYDAQAEELKDERRGDDASDEITATAEAERIAEKRARKEARRLKKEDRKAQRETDDSARRISVGGSANGKDEEKPDAVLTSRTKSKKSEKVKHSGAAIGTAELGYVIDTIGDAALDEKNSDLKTIIVKDNEGNVRRTFLPGEAIPLDKAIWNGITTKLLPRPVRSARKEYMAQKREDRKAREAKKLKADED